MEYFSFDGAASTYTVRLYDGPIPSESEMLLELLHRKSFRGAPNPYWGPRDTESITQAYKEWKTLEPHIFKQPTPEELEAREKAARPHLEENERAEFAQLKSLEDCVIKSVIKDKPYFDWEPVHYRIILEDGRTIFVDNLGLADEVQ